MRDSIVRSTVVECPIVSDGILMHHLRQNHEGRQRWKRQQLFGEVGPAGEWAFVSEGNLHRKELSDLIDLDNGLRFSLKHDLFHLLSGTNAGSVAARLDGASALAQAVAAAEALLT